MEGRIKVMSHIDCPHCQKDIVLLLEVGTPVVKSVLTKETIASAKDTLKKYVLSQGFSKDYTKEAIDWIDSETTLFGAEEIDEMLLNIKESYKQYDSGKNV